MRSLIWSLVSEAGNTFVSVSFVSVARDGPVASMLRSGSITLFGFGDCAGSTFVAGVVDGAGVVCATAETARMTDAMMATRGFMRMTMVRRTALMSSASGVSTR